MPRRAAFFENRPEDALHDSDIAGAVVWALSQPDRVDVNEILIRPTSQSSCAPRGGSARQQLVDPPGELGVVGRG